MYQRSKIPEIVIKKTWSTEEYVRLSKSLGISVKEVKYVIDFHFGGVANALWEDKTNIEVTNLIRFELKPRPVKSALEKCFAKIPYIKSNSKKHPERIVTGLTRNQVRIDYLEKKLANFKELGNDV